MAAANARADEIRRIKEAEQDALSEALGFKVEPRLREHQLAGPKEVERAMKEAAEGDEEEGGQGLGFGGFVGAVAGSGGDEVGERMMGYIVGEQGGLDGGGFQIGKKEKRRKRSKSQERRGRRGSIDGRRGRDERKQDDDGKSHKKRHHHHHHHHHHHRRRLRSPSRSRSRSRQRGGERRREDDANPRRRGRREKSYSPAATAQQQQKDLDRRRSPLSSRYKSGRAYSAQRRAAQSDDRPCSRSYRRERKDSPQLSDENAYSRQVRRERSYSPMRVRRRDRSRDDGNGDRGRTR